MNKCALALREQETALANALRQLVVDTERHGSTQTRSHNAQNEITGISGAVTPTYDANGNLTRDETGRQFVYDAWNRLVAVKDASGNTLKSYAYDGQHRRISETASGTTTDLYYSAAWQVLEERVASGGTSVPRVQYVWSPVYVDALVLRDRDTNGDGSLDERLYVAQDANFNVAALFDNSGNVVERYVYDPFGQVTILDAGWNVLAGSAFGWFYLHQGGRLDATSGLYHFRHRDYSPTLGRWTSLDPLRYDAGDVNLYRALGNGVTNRLDPSGLDYIVPDNPQPGQFVHLRRTYYLTYGWTGNKDVTITLGLVVERNGRLYVQFGGYYVPLEKVTAAALDAGGEWKDSSKQLAWFRNHATTDFSSTYGSGFRQEFGADLYGAVSKSQQAASGAYYDTYVVGPPVAIGVSAFAAGRAGAAANRAVAPARAPINNPAHNAANAARLREQLARQEFASQAVWKTSATHGNELVHHAYNRHPSLATNSNGLISPQLYHQRAVGNITNPASEIHRLGGTRYAAFNPQTGEFTVFSWEGGGGLPTGTPTIHTYYIPLRNQMTTGVPFQSQGIVNLADIRP